MKMTLSFSTLIKKQKALILAYTWTLFHSSWDTLHTYTRNKWHIWKNACTSVKYWWSLSIVNVINTEAYQQQQKTGAQKDDVLSITDLTVRFLSTTTESMARYMCDVSVETVSVSNICSEDAITLNWIHRIRGACMLFHFVSFWSKPSSPEMRLFDFMHISAAGTAQIWALICH